MGREKGVGGEFFGWFRIGRKRSRKKRMMAVVKMRATEGWRNSISFQELIGSD